MMNRFFFAAAIIAALVLDGCTTKSSDCLHAGTVVRDTLLGVPCCIYLPASYSRSAISNRSSVYPVLYLQHGMFGSEDDWTKQGNLVHWMDSLLQCGAVEEMVVIMPDNFLGSVPFEERKVLMEAPNITPEGESFDTSEGSAHWRKLTYDEEKGYEMSGYWERHFASFMAEAENKYNISREPAQRGIAGLSMGGFHTMHVSHHLHGQFAYVGLFSAAIIPTEPNEIYDKWQDEVRQQMESNTLYWIGIGREDFLYDFNTQYREWLNQNHFEYTYYESAGEHTWDNWQDYICRFLKKLFH